MRDLVKIADDVNASSDVFMAEVKHLETVLADVNMGVDACVPMSQDDGLLSVSYEKYNGRWGIFLMMPAGAIPFADAPRATRLRAVRYLPSLVGLLAENALKLDAELRTSTASVAGLIYNIKTERKEQK
jgi:hypothetical protein